MIPKPAEYRNGYIFAKNSKDNDLQDILNSYDKVKCIICNSNTRKNFIVSNGTFPISINNKLADGIFFVNGVY